MAYAKRVILNCPAGCREDLGQMVEDFLHDGVQLICAMGADAAKIEDAVDWLVIGDGSDETRFILTSSHKDETLENVIEFAHHFVTDDGDQSVQIIDLT
ncbi:MAG TPA: hypothetical protein VF920_05180 [Dongiaceae bacterium]